MSDAAWKDLTLIFTDSRLSRPSRGAWIKKKVSEPIKAFDEFTAAQAA